MKEESKQYAVPKKQKSSISYFCEDPRNGKRIEDSRRFGICSMQ